MRAHVRLRLPDGREAALYHGDQIGRLRSVALPIDDARISEAHVMVSLRGTELKLLSLRGMFAVGGKPQREVVLVEGQMLALAAGFELEVLDVVLPERVLALEGDGLPRHALAGVNSLYVSGRPDLAPKYRRDAAAHIWSHGEAWRLRIGTDERQIGVGDRFTLDGRTFRFLEMPLSTAGQSPTHMAGQVQSPLRLVAQFDTVQIHQSGQPVFVLNGIGARIVSELVAFDGPASWDVVASQIWPDSDPGDLRARWDTALSRLRRKLKKAHIRSDLISADGTGNFELVLAEHDSVEDRT